MTAIGMLGSIGAWIVATAFASAADLLPLAGDGAEVAIAADRRLIDGALACKPFSLLRDARAAAAVAHVRSQLALLERDQAPWMQLAEHAQALLLVGYGGSPPARRRVPLLLLDSGAAQRPIAAWLDRSMARERNESLVRNGFAGHGSRRSFAGLRDGLLALGEPARIDAIPAVPDAPLTRAPATATVDGRPAIAALATLAESGEDFWPLVDAALPGWRSTAPRLTVESTATVDGWRSRLRLDAIGALPLRAVDGRLLDLVRADRQIVLAIGVAPEVLVPLAAGLLLLSEPRAAADALPPAPFAHRIDTTLRRVCGVDAAALSALFTGDILIQGSSVDGQLPQMAAVLCLRQDADHGVLARLVAHLGARSEEGGAAWSLPTPAGPVRIERIGDRLALGNDGALVRALAAGTVGDGALPPAALHLRAELPALARQWLPLAVAAAAHVREPLAVDAAGGLRILLRNLRDVPAGATPATLLLDHASGQHRLRDLYPDGDLGACVDAAVAVYQRRPGWDDGGRRTRHGLGPTERHALVVRCGDERYRIIGSSEWHEPDVLPADALAARLAAYARVAGPEPARLAPTPLPERAMLDARWLPPLPAMLDHIPSYRLVATIADGGLTIDEEGLPVAGVLGGVLAYLAWAGVRDIELEQQIAAVRREHRAVQARHAPLLAVLAKAGAVLRGLAGVVPAKASDLIHPGGLSLADCAVFFGGVAPTTPQALDAVGRWQIDTPGQGPDAVWVVLLEEGWCAYLLRKGHHVVVAEQLHEVSGPPPDSGF